MTTPTSTADIPLTLDQLTAAIREAIATPPAPHSLLIPQTDVPQYVGISRAAWFRLRAGGKTPDPVALDGAGVMFRRADLDKWVARLRAG